jgi:DedD protein
MAEPSRDTTEVTLGTGKLLGIFLGLVVICAVFFTMGYMLGRGSAPSVGKTEVVASVPSSSAPAAKPSAVNKNSEPGAQPCVAGSPKCPPANGAATESATNSPETQAPASSTPTSSASSSNTSNQARPEQATGPRPGGTIIIQVAAVSKQEDAEILVSALRRKQYPAFVTNTSSDPLFHIQVGPFSDPKEADAMRGRLVNDGYNAIVKK